MRHDDIPASLVAAFREGMVIPAHPLALDPQRRLDRRRQRALSRYYLDAGAGGLAVGVHTTQFAIREAGLYVPVLEIAADVAQQRGALLIAGAIGPTTQALAEARTARALGYHAVLLGLAALRQASEDELIEHCAEIAREMPVIGFYLQAAVGGMRLSPRFWEGFARIENVIGIKVAPFNRYATLDVIRGLVAAQAEQRVALYTGNDDHILLDLVLPFRMGERSLHFAGGLLGHWSVWTEHAVSLFARARAARGGPAIPADLLALDSVMTDCNAAIFDAANGFHGVIAGCHEVLRRQGLLEGRWCLDPREDLSPGQAAEIDRVCRLYPDHTSDAFVRANLHRWLSD